MHMILTDILHLLPIPKVFYMTRHNLTVTRPLYYSLVFFALHSHSKNFTDTRWYLSTPWAWPWPSQVYRHRMMYTYFIQYFTGREDFSLSLPDPPFTIFSLANLNIGYILYPWQGWLLLTLRMVLCLKWSHYLVLKK